LKQPYRSADLVNANTLTLAGKAFAGVPFAGECQQGQCIRIMTGAELPKGADTVIMQEETTADGETITFHDKPKHGEVLLSLKCMFALLLHSFQQVMSYVLSVNH